jgi:hypothetical protein
LRSLTGRENEREGIMRKDRTGRRAFRIWGVFILASLALFGIAAPAGADMGVNVSCYLGNLYVGNAVVYDVRTAANACNDLYHICRGQCSGCFHDFDYAEDVCVSPDERMYLK